MADDGDKLVLEALDGLAFGDIEAERHDRDQLAVGVTEDGIIPLALDDPAIFGEIALTVDIALIATVEEARARGVGGRGIVGDDEREVVARAPTDDLVRAPAEDTLGGGRPTDDPPTSASHSTMATGEFSR